jgi:hypothetical protein
MAIFLLEAIGMKPKKAVPPLRPSFLLGELEAYLGEPLTAGDRKKFAITVDGLTLDIEVRARPAQTTDEITQFRNELLDEIAGGRRRSQSYRFVTYPGEIAGFVRCEAYTHGRSSACSHGCSSHAAAAIVYRASATPGNLFLLVCGRHRDSHGINARAVLATIELAPKALQNAWALGSQCWRRARNEEIAAARAAGKPVCRRCGVDGTCIVPPCEPEAR